MQEQWVVREEEIIDVFLVAFAINAKRKKLRRKNDIFNAMDQGNVE